jgi:hypothetical protein
VVISGGARLIGLSWLSAEVAYRQGVVPGAELRTSYQRLAGSAAFEVGDYLRGGVLASGDLALGLVNELSAELSVRPWRLLRITAAARYDAPVFDTDSIFVAFWSDPALEGQLRADLTLVPGIVLSGAGLVRQVGFLAPDEDEALSSGALRFGGEGRARLQRGRFLGELRARIADGYGGRRAGADLRLAARLPGDRVTLDVRGTVLGLRQDVTPFDHQVSLGYVVGARYLMTREAALLFELEHNASRLLGQQLRFLVMLDMGFWI